MAAPRLWPTVQALGRGLLSNRSEFIQQGFKAYNVQNFGGNGHSTQNASTGLHNFHSCDRRSWTQKVSRTANGSFNKIVSRTLQSGTILFVKEFKDTENEHAHSVLCSLPAYSATTVSASENIRHQPALYFDTSTLHSADWNLFTPKEVADGFVALSHCCQHKSMNLEDPQYSTLCGALTASLHHLTDDSLLQVLQSLTFWPPTESTTTPNFVGIWNALDRVCTERMKYWDIKKMFLVADHWFALRLSRISSYNLNLTKFLGKRVNKMQPTELVQYLFYANLCRQLEPFIVMRELEKRLVEVMKDLSVEELGVISMGFFKTQTFLKNEQLVDAIMSKTLVNLDVVTDASLCSILKLLRKSVPVSRSKAMLEFMNALDSHIERLNTMCLLQVALLGNDLLVFHSGIINNIALKFADCMEDLRLKDIERLTFVLMLYNFIPPSCPDIFNKIAEELRKPERVFEINHYPKCFVSCVVYLVIMGLLPVDLISAALQPSMLNHLQMSQNYSDMGREVNELDWSLEIEGPANYQGYRLDPKMRASITKKYLGRLPSPSSKGLTHQERLTLEINDKLGAMLGNDSCTKIAHVLPHNQIPDIVFCTTNEGEPVPLPQDFLNHPAHNIKFPVDPSIQWNALIIGGRNSFIRNTNSLRGHVHMKKRQLRKLGYNVSVVSFTEFSKRSLRTKLQTLCRSLKEGSSLNTEGIVESAFVNLKANSLTMEEENR
ncbi:FAST kinase domain-containing protein 5, mitochondrial [Oratosquilla oratoria]|uniref:FAST kinase domain-containing protein 5, mitochondrial n=1 Tax=Oratosquilla oratoria TaxID=337810 RepID=UPI003F776941